MKNMMLASFFILSTSLVTAALLVPACGSPTDVTSGEPSSTGTGGAGGGGGAGGAGPGSSASSGSNSASSSNSASGSSSSSAGSSSSGGSGGSGPDLPPVVFQCTAFNGGLCTMNADGSGQQTLLASGRSPDMNAAGEVLFHDDAYAVQKRLANGTTTSLGQGAFPRWTPDGHIAFQCTGLNGGLCTMNADGSARKTLLASGRSPDINTAGEILFHDDAYTVKKLLPGGTTMSLASGAFPSWTP